MKNHVDHPPLHPILAVVLFFLLALAARGVQDPTPTPTPAGAQKDVTWDAGLGYATYAAEVKAGCWYPAWIEIRADRAPVRGVATLTQAGNPLRVEVAIDVAKGTRKIYRTSYRLLDRVQNLFQSNLDIALDAEPLGHATLQTPLRYSTPGTRHLLLLTDRDRVGSFKFLTRQVERNSFTTVLGGQAIVYGQPDSLPDDPIALGSLDAILIDTAAVRAITAAQWSALRAWAAAGGQLVIATGRNQPFIQESPLRDPFGIRLGEPELISVNALFKGDTSITITSTSTSTNSLPQSAIRNPQSAIFQDASLLAAWPAPPPGGWDTIEIGDEAHPFLAGKRFGAGVVRLFAATLDPPLLTLLREHVDTYGARIFPQLPDPAPNSLLRIADAHAANFGFRLQNDFSVSLAGIRWVLLYLFLYNLVALPLNRWLCRRFGHPILFWPILVVLAAVFAWYGYRSGSERQRQNFQVNEVTFIARPAAEATARVRSLTTLFTPRRINGDMPAASRVFLSRLPLSERERTDPLTLSFDQGATLRHVTLFPWTVLNLSGEYSLAIKGAIEPVELIAPQATFRPTGVPLQHVKFVNKTSYTFRRWWLRCGNSVWAGTGKIDPGTTVTASGLAAVTSGFDNLLLKEAENAFSSTDASQPPLNRVNQTGPRNNERLTFIGEADGVCSPFAQSFTGQKTIGCIFYEQELPQLPESIKFTSDWDPGEWTPHLTWVAKTAINADNDSFSRYQTTGIAFPLNQVTIAFAPRRSRPPSDRLPVPGALALSLTLDSYPAPGAVWTSPATGRSFKLWSCPIEVFNFRTSTWDALPLKNPDSNPGVSARVSPAADYLHPDTQVLTLRLNAEPAKIFYKPNPFVKDPVTDAPVIVTGKQLFGQKLEDMFPVTVDVLQHAIERGELNTAPWNSPYAAQIVKFKITLEK